MQTRFYDSAEPGPPHGWLDADQGVPVKERSAWENAVTVAQQAARRAVESLRSSDASTQIWGSVRADGCWWIYHVIPAGEDRFGRPGRTLTALFCSATKEDFDWKTLSMIAPEMEVLAKDRSSLASLMRRIDRSQSSASLTDDLLKQPSTSWHETLQTELSHMLDDLEEGSHAYFTISGEGGICNRGQEATSPKPPDLPRAAAPPSGPPTKPIPVKKPRPSRLPLMKAFLSHALVLGIGLLIGAGLHWASTLKRPAEKPQTSQPILRSDTEAISYLRAATDYLEQSLRRRGGSPSPGKTQIQPQRPPSTPQKQAN